MFRLLSLAALIGVAYALFRRQPGGQDADAVNVPKKTRTTIIIGGSSGAPIIARLPEPLVAARGDELLWHVENETGRTQEISLDRFVKAGGPSNQPPLTKPDVERRVKAESTGEIRDKVRDDAETGRYTYSIWLNGKEAADNAVLVKDVN